MLELRKCRENPLNFKKLKQIFDTIKKMSGKTYEIQKMSEKVVEFEIICEKLVKTIKKARKTVKF